jgi:hydroxymethylpyrimidine/phosphomethylpyrimidine kinase
VTPPVVLTVSGSDATAAGGIQGDLKTFAAHRVYGANVVTAVTAQNSHGVDDMYPLPASVIGTQLAAVIDDLPLAAVKVGMLATAEIASSVTARARAGALPNLVLDPALTATGGFRRGLIAAIERLLPFVTVLTPDLDEASALVGWQVSTTADMAGAAAQLASSGPRYVVITGGDMSGDESVDAVWTNGGVRFLHGERIETRNTNGCGSTFAAAIAARLALGDGVPEALTAAKTYVSQALAGSASWRMGNGYGPLDHLGFGG